MRKSSSKRSVKISQRRNRKTCANRHSSTCSITDLFRFQDQLEFTFGIVYLIACVINFNFDMIVKCCPHSASINVDDLNTFRSSLSIFCKQFWAKYKRGNVNWSSANDGFEFDDKMPADKKWILVVSTLSNWIAVLEINLVPVACSSVWYRFDEKVEACKSQMVEHFEKSLREDVDLRQVIASISNFRVFKLFKCIDNDPDPTLFKLNYKVNVEKYNVVVDIYKQIVVKFRRLFNFPNDKNVFDTRDVFELLLHRFELLYSTLPNKRQKPSNDENDERPYIINERGEYVDFSPGGSFLRQCYNKYLYDYVLSDEHTKTVSNTFARLTRSYVLSTFPGEPQTFECINPSSGYNVQMMEQCHSMNFILYIIGKKLDKKLAEYPAAYNIFRLLKIRWGYIKERGIAIDIHKMHPSQDLVRAIDMVLKNVHLLNPHTISNTQDDLEIENFDKLKLLCIEKVLHF